MAGDFTIDTSQLVDAFRFVQQVVPRDAAEVLNKGALTAIIGSRENKYAGSVTGAMQLTPRADKAKIKAIDPRLIVVAVMKRARANGERLTRAEITKRAKQEVARRVRSVAYTAGPGWSNAAKSFGGRGVRTQSGFARSQAAHGRGWQASAGNLVAEILNTAPAIEKIGTMPLQRAINETARAMVEYGEAKLQQRFDKINAK